MNTIHSPKRAHYNEVSSTSKVSGGLVAFQTISYLVGGGLLGFGLLLLMGLVFTLDHAKPVQYYFAGMFSIIGLLMLLFGAALHIVIAIREQD